MFLHCFFKLTFVSESKEVKKKVKCNNYCKNKWIGVGTYVFYYEHEITLKA